MRLPIRSRSLLSLAVLVVVLIALTGATAPRHPARQQSARAAKSSPAVRSAAPRPLPPIVLQSMRPERYPLSPTSDCRLSVREPDGTIRDLVPRDALFDVMNPSVSLDGRRVAFSAESRPGGPTHIWIVNADGTALRDVPLPDSLWRDNLYPCWIAPHHLAFVRYHRMIREWSLPSDVYVVRDDGTHLARLTAEMGNPVEPVLDSATGRLMYNRGKGLRRQIVSVTPGIDDVRLAAGPVDSTVGSLFEPAPLGDGRVAALVSKGWRSSVAIFGAQEDAGRGDLPRAIGPPRILAGPRASSPAALPDGRLLVCEGAASRGELTQLYVMDADGTHRELLFGLPSSYSLIARPLVPTTPHVAESDSALDAPRAGDTTFAMHSLNIFADGAVDVSLPSPLLLADSLRLRVLAGFETRAGGDSTVLLREVPLHPDGSVRVDSLPVDVPLFVELLGPDGRALLSAHGFGRTAWVNAGSPREQRCVGCHAGHSALPVPPDDEAARWFNAAPSAEVTTSSSAPGTAGPRAIVDRRTRGAAREVAWISASAVDQWLKLRWSRPLEIRELALHGLQPSRDGRVTVRACEVVLRLKGTELSRRLVNVPLGPEPTHVGVGLTVADEVEIRFLRVSGLALGKRAAALAEVEAIARVP